MNNKWINYFLMMLASSLAMPAYAVAPGFYMGLMTGPATNSGSNVQAQVNTTVRTLATPRSQQWGSRLYMGYKMNQYAGVEGGLNYFSTIRYDTRDVDTCTGTSSRVRYFDLVGKADYAFANFNVFGKAGLAITYLTTSGSLNPGTDPNNPTCGRNQYTTKFNPTFAIGASYELTQNWVADITWNRTLVGHPVNNVDFYALGISYHFVNIYCGQFLCS